jgi:hypothetical protein
MEVVISLAKSDQGTDPRILGSIFTRPGLCADDVAKAVDAEGGLVGKYDTCQPSEEKHAEGTSNEVSKPEGDEDVDDERDSPIIFLLPHDQRVGFEVGNITEIFSTFVGMENPSHVRPPETASGIIGIFSMIGVLVVTSVGSRPD